ncbi:MAG TPA: four helix bundle protein [bacterium]|nr:four helix bundle protein [bacterium]
MATLKRFQDIEAWQKARELTRAVYKCSGSGRFAKDFVLRDQIRRASVSIMSNIAEGFGRGGSKELINFLSIAKGSAAELESQLYIALDQGYILKPEFEELQRMAKSAQNLLAGFVNYLKKCDLSGQKYKK